MVLFFDIDGTLLSTTGAGVTAMQTAARRRFGEAFSFDGIPVAGRLDPLIIADAFARNGIADTPEHHAAVRADLREVGPEKAGRRVAMKVVKNQLASPGEAELLFLEGEGWSAEWEMVELGLRHGVLKKVGTAVWFGAELCGAAELRGDVDLCVRLNSAIRAVMGLPQRKPVGRAAGSAVSVRRAQGG